MDAWFDLPRPCPPSSSGDTRGPLYISVVSQLALPLGICFAIQATAGLEAHHIWLAILTGHIARCLLSMARFRQGAWQGIDVGI